MDLKLAQLIEQMLSLISITANQAWWEHHGEHCGSDFNIATCENCFAFEQCKRNETLVGLFKALQWAVR